MKASKIPPADHAKELGGLLVRIQRRIEFRQREGKPTHVEEREIAAIRWVAVEAAAAEKLRAELAALKRATQEEKHAET